MDKNKLETINSHSLETTSLLEQENEIAQKILNDLSGTLVIRAKVILDFCKEAIDYSVVKF